MRLTARSEYGLLALIDLGARYGDGPVSAREISQRQGVPGKFLEQLLAALRKAGIVSASRGAHGGFLLTRDPSEITVLEVVEALEGPLAPTVCDGGAQCERSGACAAAGVWAKATAALREVFLTTTIADLSNRQAQYDESTSTGGQKERMAR
ncbi:MAG TPA: RrF2 family transcriptional regulator [Coriobacteriia bacterium]